MLSPESCPDVPEQNRRDELADFLRTRRSRLVPAQVGLPGGARRRTPGLRREEVALLAEVGLTWYTFLEQGRPIKVSAETLGRIARALRLAPLEVEHLFALAERPLTSVASDEQLPDVVRALIDTIGPIPVHVVNPCYDILAWNLAATVVWLHPATIPEHDRNFLWLFFGKPEVRALLTDWELHARQLMAQFRFTYGQNQDDPRFEPLIERCREASPEFREWWAQHEVVHRQAGSVSLEHPRGRLRFDAAMFHPDPAPTLRVIFNIPQPGTGTRETVLALMEESGGAAASSPRTAAPRLEQSRAS